MAITLAKINYSKNYFVNKLQNFSIKFPFGLAFFLT